MKLKTKYSYVVRSDREWTDKSGKLHQRYAWKEHVCNDEREAIAFVDKLERRRDVVCAWYLKVDDA